MVARVTIWNYSVRSESYWSIFSKLPEEKSGIEEHDLINQVKDR